MHRIDRYRNRGFDCLCGNLRMASRAVTAVYDRHLAAAGFQASQMTVLWVVAALRDASIKDLAARVVMDETTLLRNLRVLERRGWVSIVVGDDRRKRLVALTPEGRQVFSDALPHWERAQQEVAAAFAARGLEGINAQLLRLTGALR